MKNKLILLAALCVPPLLPACATPTAVPLQAAASTDGIMGAATLARTGTCEMDIAADMTALVIYRQRAARAVTRGQITVAQARQVQTLADSARADLDAACPNANAMFDVGRREAARATLKTIAPILEKKP